MQVWEALEAYLGEYLQAAGIAGDRKGLLFRTAIGKTRQLSDQTMTRADVYRMIKRRVRGGGVRTRISCHTFRATGITAYLKNGGRSRWPNEWRATPTQRPPGSTTGAPMRFLSMKSNGLRFELIRTYIMRCRSDTDKGVHCFSPNLLSEENKMKRVMIDFMIALSFYSASILRAVWGYSVADQQTDIFLFRVRLDLL